MHAFCSIILYKGFPIKKYKYRSCYPLGVLLKHYKTKPGVRFYVKSAINFFRCLSPCGPATWKGWALGFLAKPFGADVFFFKWLSFFSQFTDFFCSYIVWCVWATKTAVAANLYLTIWQTGTFWASGMWDFLVALINYTNYFLHFFKKCSQTSL